MIISGALPLRNILYRLRPLGLGAALAAAALYGLAGLASAGELGPTPSDWDDLNWRDLKTSRAAFICLSDSPASWCKDWWESRDEKPMRLVDEDEDGMRRTGLPRRVVAIPEAQWQEVLERISLGPPNRGDFLKLSLRALQDSDIAAMEVLAHAYASGRGVERDYVKAYEYYGRVYYAGAEHVKPNLDQVWAFLSDDERRRLMGLFAPGTVPDRL